MDVQRVGSGVVAGFVGGVVFGVMMQMMGMLGMVAGLVGQDSVAIGWIVHLAISAGIGAGYGLTFGQLQQSWGRGAGYGIVYGVIWWILGPLLIMPLWLGMPALQVGGMQLQSLVGHLMFGIVTALTFTALVRKTSAETHEPAYNR